MKWFIPVETFELSAPSPESSQGQQNEKLLKGGPNYTDTYEGLNASERFCFMIR